MDNQTHINTVERNKAASKLCKQLFPSWNKPPAQGELQRIIIDSWRENNDTEAICKAGSWWLWARELFIENTFSKQEKSNLLKIAISASTGKHQIHLVSARSPELLHAQVEGQGDFDLPRSTSSFSKLAKLQIESANFIPTQVTVVFADLAIDNYDRINQVCDIEQTIMENIQKLHLIASEVGLDNLRIVRASELRVGDTILGDLIDKAGNSKPVELDSRAHNLIEIASRESQQSHFNMFGWNEKQSKNHTMHLAVTMGRVGQAVKQLSPPAVLIHNESFISRGALNNIFNEPNDPLPVICLRDLLESKRSRV